MTRRIVAVTLLSAAVVGLFVGMAMGVLQSQPPPQQNRAAGLEPEAADVPSPSPSPTATPSPDPTETAGPPRGRTYIMTNKLTGRAADVDGEGREDGTRVILFQPHGRANQQWTVRDAGDGLVNLISVQSGKCLQIEDESRQEGAPAEISECTGDDDQRWSFAENQDGWRITSERSGLVLDADDDDLPTALQREFDDTQRSQVWFLTPIG